MDLHEPVEQRAGPNEPGSSAHPAIGTAEAKTHFSQVLDRVEHRGETITITRHGQPVADLVPRRPEAAPSFNDWWLGGPTLPEGFEVPERQGGHRSDPFKDVRADAREPG
jgi:prevent-host-death family protein